MFRDYYLALSKDEREYFCKETGISAHTIRNGYVKEDPLERVMPTTERIAKMIVVSQKLQHKPPLNVYGLRGHFFDEVIFALLKDHFDYQE